MTEYLSGWEQLENSLEPDQKGDLVDFAEEVSSVLQAGEAHGRYLSRGTVQLNFCLER